MCRALEAAHRAGIIHRDLKPSNVMLVRPSDEQGDLVKVLDFGVAKFLRDEGGPNLTVPDAAVGTPRFMAPEQIGGAAWWISAPISTRWGTALLHAERRALAHRGQQRAERVAAQADRDPTPCTLSFRSARRPRSPYHAVPGSGRRPAPCLGRRSQETPARGLEEARTISSSLAGLRVPSTTAVVPSPSDGSLWWKTIAVVTATAVVGWIAARPFFVHRPARPHAALSQARATAPPPAANDATTTR